MVKSKENTIEEMESIRKSTGEKDAESKSSSADVQTDTDNLMSRIIRETPRDKEDTDEMYWKKLQEKLNNISKTDYGNTTKK